jgi:hypothetical protein
VYNTVLLHNRKERTKFVKIRVGSDKEELISPFPRLILLPEVAGISGGCSGAAKKRHGGFKRYDKCKSAVASIVVFSFQEKRTCLYMHTYFFHFRCQLDIFWTTHSVTNAVLILRETNLGNPELLEVWSFEE